MTAAVAPVSREAFAAAQIEMTVGWYEGLLRSGRDVEAYFAERRKAYLDRWREAARYIGKGGRVLDIGGGNLFAEQFAFFRSMNWDYWYADIGAGEVAAARTLAAAQGCDPSHFSQRFNHELSYEAEAFDGVFSSHCIEHSMDLALTLRQVNSLLRTGGNFVMSVPFGFDAQPNHPYFLSEMEWMILLEDSGFAIRAYQVGAEYPENAEDLLIAARKIGPPGPLRLDLARYHKANFTFHDIRLGDFQTTGTRVDKDQHIILDADWSLDIAVPLGAVEVAPVFIRHDWSGVVAVRSAGAVVMEDLFRPQVCASPVRLVLPAPAAPDQRVEVSPVGRHPASRGAQAVFMGYLSR